MTPRESEDRAAVVELAGPAGAGKTTVARLLQGASPSVVTTPSTGRLRLTSGLVRMMPRLAAARLSAPGRSWSRGELRNLGYLSAWQSQLGANEGVVGLVVLDHGPVFRLASLAQNGPPMTCTRSFAGLWRQLAQEWGELLDLVVWLDAPDSELLKRIRGRERCHRIKAAAPAEAAAFLNSYRAAYRTTLSAVTQGRTRVVELDSGAQRPDELAAQIRTMVLTVPSRRSP